MARFNVPPYWPASPVGWTPPRGWRPDPAWPPPPHGWAFWTDDYGRPEAGPAGYYGAATGARSWVRRHKTFTGLVALLLLFAWVANVETEQVPVTSDTSAAGAGRALQAPTAEVAPPSTPADASDDLPPTSEAIPASPATPSSPFDAPDDGQHATVERIVDGDTIAIRALTAGPILASTAQITVRLLEIDTPETKHPTEPVQCFGPEATAFTQQLLPVGSTVWVVPDNERTDRYGRDLLYVWNSKEIFVNREIVLNGFAAAALYEPNDRYINEIREAEAEAESAGRGLWTACAHPAPPPPTPVPAALQPEPVVPAPTGNCDSAYPTVCIPPSPPDLDCGEVSDRRFGVLSPDPHRFDADHDGIGCEN